MLAAMRSMRVPWALVGETLHATKASAERKRREASGDTSTAGDASVRDKVVEFLQGIDDRRLKSATAFTFAPYPAPSTQAQTKAT
jgi:hypothetical protein